MIRPLKDDDDINFEPAIDFATTHLAPRAPTNPKFLEDLETTMALTMFRRNDLTPPLAELLQPSLRQTIAREVNQALLEASGERAMATLGDLIAHRAWAQQRALKERRDLVPDSLDLGLDPVQSKSGAQPENTVSTGNNDGDAMATGWEAS